MKYRLKGSKVSENLSLIREAIKKEIDGKRKYVLQNERIICKESDSWKIKWYFLHLSDQLNHIPHIGYNLQRQHFAFIRYQYTSLVLKFIL